MLRLGCMAFGGPAAHLAFFERELVEKRRWVDAAEFADLIAFCQFLPGPASSQVGMCLGMRRAGFFGMLSAWFAFSLPSVIVLMLVAGGLNHWSTSPGPWLMGLLAGVVAIVADAVLKMGRKLCPERRTQSFAVGAACLMLLLPYAWTQIVVILCGAVLGLVCLKAPQRSLGEPDSNVKGGLSAGVGWLILGCGVLLPASLTWWSGGLEMPLLVRMYAAFAKTGALVFGGGHVVLPMLEAEVVTPGWMSHEQFLSGYGVTQAMPGPIFTLSAFLGATAGLNAGATGVQVVLYGAVAFLGIFMPSFGFVAALLPLWGRLRQSSQAQRALAGINASVVGLLIAALYRPVWTKAVGGELPSLAVGLVLLSLHLLMHWKLPAWLTLIVAAGLAQAGALVFF